MKRTIRSKESHQYLADGKWVSDGRLAQDFQNTELTISEVQRLKLKDVEMVLVMGEQPSEHDITLPLFTSEFYDGAGTL